MMKETPAKLIENVAEELNIQIRHGGVSRSIELGVRSLGFQGPPEIVGNVPFIVYQYDGGSSTVAFQGLRETERAIAYTLWHNDIHQAELAEHHFYEALLKTKRVVGASQIFSFTDDSTARSIGHGPGGLSGIQREVLIRR